MESPVLSPEEKCVCFSCVWAAAAAGSASVWYNKKDLCLTVYGVM